MRIPNAVLRMLLILVCLSFVFRTDAKSRKKKKTQNPFAKYIEEIYQTERMIKNSNPAQSKALEEILNKAKENKENKYEELKKSLSEKKQEIEKEISVAKTDEDKMAAEKKQRKIDAKLKKLDKWANMTYKELKEQQKKKSKRKKKKSSKKSKKN